MNQNTGKTRRYCAFVLFYVVLIIKLAGYNRNAAAAASSWKWLVIDAPWCVVACDTMRSNSVGVSPTMPSNIFIDISLAIILVIEPFLTSCAGAVSAGSTVQWEHHGNAISGNTVCGRIAQFLTS
jgi:hypothetical protein